MSAMRYRGPNDEGVDLLETGQGTLALGHTRLSIIDLTSGGHQPMRSASGRFTIVFNGEIYNYRELREELSAMRYPFRTNSDTEVLLAAWEAWGRECLKRLTGMFAFAIYDQVQKKLSLARDAFGIKPFYYTAEKGFFAFASEIAPLFCLVPNTPTPNLQTAYNYLLYGDYDEFGITFFKGIRQLPPGHIFDLDINSGEANEPERWWWPTIQKRHTASFDQEVEKLRDLFLNSLKLHLRSDVNIGATLSGGIDSSAIVCGIRHIERTLPIHTFSYIPSQKSVSEEQYINIVNKHVSAIPHKVEITPEELKNACSDLIRSQGEPFGGPSIFAQYAVFKLARQNNIVVTLDGQGADELLAGYNGSPSQRILSLIDGREYYTAINFLLNWSRWPNRSLAKAVGSLLKDFTLRKHQVLPRRLAGHTPTPDWVDFRKLDALGVAKFEEKEKPVFCSRRRVMASLRHNLSGGELSKLLRHADRNSMRWSIECRTPFLTTEISDFLLGLPEDYLISSNGETKKIFRAAMRGIVPDAILDRRDKIGFAAPENQLIVPLCHHCVLNRDSISHIPFLKKDAVIRELNEYILKRKSPSAMGWRLVNLIAWSNEFLAN
jgi:asparagine synthase (glutamine-hydrolysing)